MKYTVQSIDAFERQAKRLVRKYPSLPNELQKLIDELKEEPNKGTALGYNCYKIRLAIASKGKGKSGGPRVITNVLVTDTTVFLLAIYNKSNQETISEKKVKDLLKNIQK